MKHHVVFLLSDENRWEHMLANINHLNKNKDLIDRIAIVVISTAILSCLKNTEMEDFKAKVKELSELNVDFFLCINTCKRFGITPDMILPEFTIASEGGLAKVISLEALGYHLFSLG